MQFVVDKSMSKRGFNIKEIFHFQLTFNVIYLTYHLFELRSINIKLVI